MCWLRNGTSKGCPSLDNGWPVLSPGLDDGNLKGFLRAHCLGADGFKVIFGLPNEPQMKAPLITAVDAALTGAGQFHNDSFFLQQLEKTGLISRHELQRLVVGDLGGGLVESDGAKSHPHLNLRFKDVASQLLGVRLHHYQEIASRAANNPLNGPAGVILLALNGNKADIVVEAVRRHNHLFAVQGEIYGNAFVPYSALRLGRDTIAIGRVVGGNDRAHRTKLAQFVVQAVPPFGERNEAAA